MPITTINGLTDIAQIRPLSKFWTYYRIASEAQVLTNTVNNEKVQETNVRYHINAAISHIADLLSLAMEPWYGVNIKATIEASAHDFGLDYVDLTSGGNTALDMARFLHHIERVNIASGTRKGNMTKWDLSMLTQQKSDWNVQHAQTAAWTHFGNDLLLLFGNDIESTVNTGAASYSYDVTSSDIVIAAYRQPLLDDMLVPSTSITYLRTKDSSAPTITEFVDLPDKYCKLLIDMVQASILQQINVDVPKAVEQNINQATAQLTQMIEAKRQFEVNSKQGFDRGITRLTPPGAV